MCGYKPAGFVLSPTNPAVTEALDAKRLKVMLESTSDGAREALLAAPSDG